MASRRNPVKIQKHHYINRELSWIEFNARVLEEAIDPGTPLLERIKFMAVFSRNFDEFFMVRVAGLKKMQSDGLTSCDLPDESPIAEILRRIRTRTNELVALQYQCLQEEILPWLAAHNIRLLPYAELDQRERAQTTKFFQEKIFPVLTPLAVDSSHPVPFLTNLTLYLVVEFELNPEQDPSDLVIGFVEVPSNLNRLIPVRREKPFARTFVLLEDVIKANLQHLFLGGFAVKRCATVRVTRNFDYGLLEHRVTDLLESVKREVINREQQEPVRIEICGSLSKGLLNKLRGILNLKDSDIYTVPYMLFISGLMTLYDLPLEDLRDPEFNPRIPVRLKQKGSFFSIIKDGDVLVHHPYESFSAVVSFLGEAIRDKDVLAIKQTLYRSSGDSPVIDLLIKGAETGKRITVVVEIKARFDEQKNIVWAKRLERAGVNVVYGFVGLKTHCKTTLVVRKEKNKIVRYVHLATGNYNAQTARVYTDLGVFSAAPELGEDVSSLFNLLTGFNTFSRKEVAKTPGLIPKFSSLMVAPINLRERITQEIDGVIAKATRAHPGKITAKINGLADKEIINSLYRASQAGVKVKLIVRGICCLCAGIPGVSDNIEVISIVDRFLEHSRIYVFESAGEVRVFLGSADWMTRSMDRRIEIIFPITDEQIKKRICNEILATYWSDNVKAREMRNDGSYVRRERDTKQVRAQQRFIELAREQGVQSFPSAQALRLGKNGRNGGAKKKPKKE